MSWPIQQLREHLALTNNDLLVVLSEYERKINYLETRVRHVEGFILKVQPFLDTMVLLQPNPNSEREAP